MTRNDHVPHVASILGAMFTVLVAFVALGQESASAQQFAKLSVVAAPGVDNAQRVAGSRLRTARHDANVISPDSLSFLPPVAYDSGGYTASAIAVGDVNGDGKLDIVMGNECASSGCLTGGAGVGVLLGNGDGTFQAAVTYGTGGDSGPFRPVSIAIADVNGDHKPDLVVANGHSNSVGVLLGNGDGTFKPAATYGSGAFFPMSVAVADVNGDGKPDIAVANECGPVFCDGSVGVLLGNGDGTFRSVVTYSSGGSYGLSVAIADVNSDGRPDLLVANGCVSFNFCGTKGAVAVLLGNGDGTFQTATEYLSGGSYPYSLKVADLNGDGKLDLVAANSDSGTVGVLLGRGDGTFRAAMVYSSGDTRNVIQISSVAVADVNGDGRPDLLLTTESMGGNGNNGGAVSMLLGNGDGTFQTAVEFPSGGYQTLGVAAGDVNGDGASDVLIANSCNQNNIGCGAGGNQIRGAVTVLLNTTAGLSTTSTSLISSLNPSIYGQAVTWTATITSSGSITPTGKVTFTWSGNTIGTATLNASGVGTLTKSNLNADAFPLTAVYSGDAANLGSTSAVLNQVVKQTSSAATLTSSPNPSTQGQAVTFTATITSPTVTAQGPVTFTAGTKVLGTAQLSSGHAKLTISSLAVGSTKITATYYGDSDIAKTSASVTQTVK